ncbi:DUF6770 family protein [Cytophaga aurantiaca]|uniref:DUF6770 family protein n=1 Tax=Cytophaga aurantiaca TaxID=29530 RepID=UPI00036434F0|nr:DUF6770 family protein [Cytophaga aurantiaca]
MRILASLSLLFALSLCSLAQTKTINNIKKMQSSAINYIMKDNVVSGYVVLYKVDKVDKVNSTYLLSILNTNLEETASKTLVEANALFLAESDFNGESIMLKFVDPKKKIIKYYCYDLNAELLFQKDEIITSTWELYSLQAYANSESGIEVSTLVGIENSGYVNYGIVDNKKTGYQISYTSTDGKKTWKVGSDVASKDMIFASFLEQNENILLSTIVTKPSLFSNDLKYTVSGIDINTGKELFNVSLDDATHKAQPLEAFFDKAANKIRIMGLYFDPKDNMVKDLSKGMFNVSISLDGKVTSSAYIGWQEGLSKYFKVKDNGKIEDIGYFFFHNIVKLNDGSFYAITEQYKKKLDGVGMALAAGGSSNGMPCNIVMEDMYIMEFTSDFKLKEVTKFDKTVSKFYFDKEGMMDAQTLALFVKAAGGFDYQYTLINKDDSRFFVSYLDYVKDEEDKRYGYELCYIVKGINEPFTTDKIKLTSKTKTIRTLAAKTGYVMIYEYDKKLKTVDLRLEKINY